MVAKAQETNLDIQSEGAVVQAGPSQRALGALK
jgi:hypothetical protein